MTRGEHIARAMLLGMTYDHNDHTYVSPDDAVVLDADTLENFGKVFDYVFNNPLYTKRKVMVKNKEIGCDEG